MLKPFRTINNRITSSIRKFASLNGENNEKKKEYGSYIAREDGSYFRGSDMYCKETTAFHKMINGNRFYRTEGFQFYVKKYGLPFISIHTSLSILNFGCMYFCVKQGVDMDSFYESVMEFCGILYILPPDIGNFALAYACHKVTFPPRLLLSTILAKKYVDFHQKNE